jgi:hypothetical protein
VQALLAQWRAIAGRRRVSGLDLTVFQYVGLVLHTVERFRHERLVLHDLPNGDFGPSTPRWCECRRRTGKYTQKLLQYIMILI